MNTVMGIVMYNISFMKSVLKTTNFVKLIFFSYLTTEHSSTVEHVLNFLGQQHSAEDSL